MEEERDHAEGGNTQYLSGKRCTGDTPEVVESRGCSRGERKSQRVDGVEKKSSYVYGIIYLCFI